MASPALKNNSTQKFIEIIDVFDDIVILSGGNACIIVEVQATNFDLLSAEEQEAKIYAYSSLLNSLSFPIQILIRSKKVDVSDYLLSLEAQIKKAKTPQLANQINLYKGFVSELVKINIVLDKKFYIVIPYYSLEKGAFGAKQVLDKNAVAAFSNQAKSALKTKAETIHSQLSRIGLKAETLEKEKIVKLFYNIFNDEGMYSSHAPVQAKTPVVKGGK